MCLLHRKLSTFSYSYNPEVIAQEITTEYQIVIQVIIPALHCSNPKIRRGSNMLLVHTEYALS